MDPSGRQAAPRHHGHFRPVPGEEEGDGGRNADRAGRGEIRGTGDGGRGAGG